MYENKNKNKNTSGQRLKPGHENTTLAFYRLCFFPKLSVWAWKTAFQRLLTEDYNSLCALFQLEPFGLLKWNCL